jgi:hypothetical protein
MRSILPTLIPLTLAACATAPPGRTEPVGGQRALWEGESAQAYDLRVRFDQVDHDSRCRPGVQCIREGEAVAVFTVSTDTAGGPPLRIQVSSRDSARATFGQYRIQVDSLSPRPAPPGRYRVWLSLSRG